MKIKIGIIILLFSASGFAAAPILCPTAATLRQTYVFYMSFGQEYYFTEVNNGETYEVMVSVANSRHDAEKILNSITNSYSRYARTIPNGKGNTLTFCTYAPYGINPSIKKLDVLWLVA